MIHDLDTCTYCAKPLAPILDEYGDQMTWYGCDVVGCKSGHQFVMVTENIVEGEGRQPVSQAQAA